MTRTVVVAFVTVLAPIATGFVVGAVVWAAFLRWWLERQPGPGHLAAVLGGSFVALVCYLLTMPGGPLDHFGASGRRPPKP